MLLNQDAAAMSGATMPAASACGNCGAVERWILHHVRHRGIFRRLCTSCVLRLHPQYFCPTCFAVYHPSPPPSGSNDVVRCFKCYSSSHSHCVGPNPPSPYICPLCANPNSPISVLKNAKDFDISDDADGRGVNFENSRVIDYVAARILLAASRISVVLMSKAAFAARAEAERMAEEAALARKRAREALEHAAVIFAGKKNKKNGTSLAFSWSGGNVDGVFAYRRDSINNNSGRVGNASSGKVVVGVGAREGKNQVGNVEGVKPQGGVLGPSLNDVATIDVEKNERVSVNPSRNDSRSGAQNCGFDDANERCGDPGLPKNQDDQRKKLSWPEEGQMQAVENVDDDDPGSRQ